jgi:hypothetical protein
MESEALIEIYNLYVKFLEIMYSPLSVTAKVTKLIGLSPPLFLSPMNLVTFAGTQNGE